MTDTPLPAQLPEGLSAIETQRQERLLASTIAEGSLSLLVLEEAFRRERLEQLRRHEAALTELSTVLSARAQDTDLCLSNTVLSASLLSVEEPLSWEVVDRLNDEDVERIWQRERRMLEHNIGLVSKRVRRLQQRKSGL
ncbi:hypothetical protein CGC20_5305 [Leishmania donovani]|uniref:Uncharacterized protein n=1 Tax=Leishmania donovani TaxID=5661 RepID=A0A504XU72_LEIDO|nr:hypothetical protein CGC21_32155 [Leishmania donovani]TPP52044.1 hypothetical protein CGC20_5305 [Leishmania donovani]